MLMYHPQEKNDLHYHCMYTESRLSKALPNSITKPEDQRSCNFGPVNVHLISGPTISTKTNFAKVTHCRKIGQDKLKVMIYILNKKES